MSGCVCCVRPPTSASVQITRVHRACVCYVTCFAACAECVRRGYAYVCCCIPNAFYKYIYNVYAHFSGNTSGISGLAERHIFRQNIIGIENVECATRDAAALRCSCRLVALAQLTRRSKLMSCGVYISVPRRRCAATLHRRRRQQLIVYIGSMSNE